RDRIADVTNLIADQRRARGGDCRRSVAPLARLVSRHVAEAVGGPVGAGQHGQDAGRAASRRDVHGSDARVGMGRTDDHGVRLVRQAHVVGVTPESLDQARVFETADRLADRELFDGDWFTHDGAAVYARYRASGILAHTLGNAVQGPRRDGE